MHFQPQEGRVIAFPGWLSHAVQPNLTALEGPAGDRISISFNFRQRRIGAPPRDGEVVRGDLGAG